MKKLVESVSSGNKCSCEVVAKRGKNFIPMTVSLSNKMQEILKE